MMKKILIIILICFSFSMVQSQEIQDAVRFSQDNLNGTSRFRAMGGAFGALGGDLSSLNVNPAGSAVFSNNQVGVSLNSLKKENESDYFGTKNLSSNTAFDLNQVGGVFVFKNQNTSSNWKKFSIAVNYDNINDFDNSAISSGTNPTNSVANYFVSYSNFGNDGAPVPQKFVKTNAGQSISDLYSYLGRSLPNELHPKLAGYDAQQAMLGYQGYIINVMDDSNNNSPYISNVTPGGNYYQKNVMASAGYNGKLSFNAASSYMDRLLIGINLNSHFVDYVSNSTFYESNTNPLGPDYTIRNLQFNNNLHTYGTGFSFQIGTIAKVTNEVRLGLSYESPTWLRLNDEFSQSISAVRINDLDQPETDIVDPNIINYYDPYKLSTPGKITGSFAYIFGKNGLVSIDYSLKDYGSTKFIPESNPYYSSLNSKMSDDLTTAGELRVGAEYKIKQWSLRGGYRFEQSPYENGTTIGDLNSVSGGLGYDFGTMKLDLSYSNAQRNTQQPFFSRGFNDAPNIKAINDNFTLTLLFEM